MKLKVKFRVMEKVAGYGCGADQQIGVFGTEEQAEACAAEDVPGDLLGDTERYIEKVWTTR